MSKDIESAENDESESSSSSAILFRPSLLRLAWFRHSLMLRFAILTWLIVSVFCIIAIFLKETFNFLPITLGAAAVLALALFLSWREFRVVAHQSRHFKEKFLTASIVENETANSFIHIAMLSKGGIKKDYQYGILRTAHGEIPKPIKYLSSLESVRSWDVNYTLKTLKMEQQARCEEASRAERARKSSKKFKSGAFLKMVEEILGRPTSWKSHRFASVAVLNDEEADSPTYESFTPTPVAFGISDNKKLRRCLKAVSNDREKDCFTVLRRFLNQNKMPNGCKEMVVCDRYGILMETRVIRKKDAVPLPR